MLVLLRRLLVVVVALVFLLIAAVLAYVNPDPIALDIGLMRFERVSLSLVIALTFVAGALFGGVIFGFAVLRHFRERRGLKQDLKRSERELDSLRSLMRPDAD